MESITVHVIIHPFSVTNLKAGFATISPPTLKKILTPIINLLKAFSGCDI